MSIGGLLDKNFIVTQLTADDPWCFSHGSGDGSDDLGAGMIYYSLAYSLKATLCVCLGSGGGFVPRMMRQAQRDLGLDGGRTLLVDGASEVDELKKSIWGSPCWADVDSPFRTRFPDVEIIFKLTRAAWVEDFLPQKLIIDFLHIDADHHYEGVKEDFDLYSPLVSDRGVITLHDTLNYREPCGVYRLLDEIRAGIEYEVVNLPISYGTAILRKKESASS